MPGVSAGPPDESFGEGNPFRGLPMFGDLAKLFGDQGLVSWDAARQLALSIAGGGEPEPNVDPVERIKLTELGRVAELHVASATGLDTAVDGHQATITPVTRSQWARRTLDAHRELVETLAGSLKPAEDDDDDDDALEGYGEALWMAPLMKMVGPMMLGMTAGSLVGHLARRTFGQYDLPMPRPVNEEILVVPANLDEFSEAWSLPADDLRLWVCLHELTHHAVLGVPHVRARLTELLHAYVRGFEPNTGSIEDRLSGVEISDPASLDLQSLFADPEVMLGAVQSDAQRMLLPQLQALVTTVVGYVDHVMDTVGTGLIGSYGMLTEAIRRRRAEAAPADRFVERLFGLELTRSQYERGEQFVTGLVDRAGEEVLARLWESAQTLPTPAEVDAPGLWLARLELDLPG